MNRKEVLLKNKENNYEIELFFFASKGLSKSFRKLISRREIQLLFIKYIFREITLLDLELLKLNLLVIK